MRRIQNAYLAQEIRLDVLRRQDGGVLEQAARAAFPDLDGPECKRFRHAKQCIAGEERMCSRSVDDDAIDQPVSPEAPRLQPILQRSREMPGLRQLHDQALEQIGVLLVQFTRQDRYAGLAHFKARLQDQEELGGKRMRRSIFAPIRGVKGITHLRGVGNHIAQTG